MAPAIPVGSGVDVWWRGDFGKAVARMLEPGRSRPLGQATDVARSPRAQAAVVVIERPDPDLLAAVWTECSRARLDWLSVVRGVNYIQVGPWMSPPRGPCPECQHRRSAQHNPQHALDEMVAAGLGASDASWSPPLVPAELLTVAAAVRILDARSGDRASVSRIRLHGGALPSVDSLTLVRCAPCGRCRSHD